MKVGRRTGRVLIVIGLCFALPHCGWGAFPGGILVYAWDSSTGASPPPATDAHLNGTENQSFGTNDLVTFSGSFEAGTNAVEVSTASDGYLLRPSPTDPAAINDPYSAYGNPRYVEISETNSYVPVSFQFDPVVYASASVRDAWTMERLEGATVAFMFESATGSVAVSCYPATATYATNWLSDTDGVFPSNMILYLDDYDLQVTRSGYQSYTEDGVITNASPGDAFSLGTIFLQPVDNNSNLIADVWETSYFGAGSNVVASADADGDGMSNRDEYVAGTDPTNQTSRLWTESVLATNGLALIWPVEPDRTYRVCGTTNLCSTNAWLQVGGPWEASGTQYEMVWTETNMDLSWNSNYRIEVIPSWWQESNQILINTNRPAPPSGGGSYTNGPPLPGS